MAHYYKQIQPVNNYIGLNFLRERLANRTWDGNSECSTARDLSLDGRPTGGAGLGNNRGGFCHMLRHMRSNFVTRCHTPMISALLIDGSFL